MSNKFTDLFGGFENERMQEAFADCEIKNVKISMEKKNTAHLTTHYPLSKSSSTEQVKMLPVR